MEHMLPRDADECRQFGNSPGRALWGSLAVTDWAVSLGDWRTPVAIVGVGAVPENTSVGRPWLLSSVLAPLYPRGLLAAVRQCVDAMHVTYPALVNKASEAHSSSLTLIRHLGFVLEEPMDGTVYFYKIKPHV